MVVVFDAKVYFRSKSEILKALQYCIITCKEAHRAELSRIIKILIVNFMAGMLGPFSHPQGNVTDEVEAF
jgi:hypothetical protein